MTDGHTDQRTQSFQYARQLRNGGAYKERKQVSDLMLYAQSTSTVISGRIIKIKIKNREEKGQRIRIRTQMKG